MTRPTVQQYTSTLWNAAGSPQARTFLPWLLFFRRISDNGGGREENAADFEISSEKPVVVPGPHSWSEIRGQSRDIGLRLAVAFHAIEDANPDLAGLLSHPDFGDGKAFPDPVLQMILAAVESLPLGASQMDDETFGDLCEELALKAVSDLQAFPGGPATPGPVARLLVEILQPQEGMSIYDGACGAGRLLRECHRHMRRRQKNAASLRFYGQEIDPNTWALCRITMLCSGVRAAVIEHGDSLRNPRHLTGDGRALMSFDRVITHPPFAMKDWGFEEWSRGDPYGRGEYGIPPKACADLAFLEHSVASLNSRGRLGAVAPQGILFRAREEGEIRRRMLQDDLVEAVIGLAPDVLSPASVPPCLLILNKAKQKERRGKVLLVNALSTDGSGLHDEAVDRIASACRFFEDSEGFCRVVSLGEIERNGFALGVSRYVPADTQAPRADLAAEWQALQELIGERDEAERKLAEHMKRLERGRGDQ